MPGQTLLMAGTLLMLAATISGAGTARAADEAVALFLPEGWHTAGSKPDQYDMGAQALDRVFVGVVRCKYAEDDPRASRQNRTPKPTARETLPCEGGLPSLVRSVLVCGSGCGMTLPKQFGPHLRFVQIGCLLGDVANGIV
jgi:hypothetical protein